MPKGTAKAAWLRGGIAVWGPWNQRVEQCHQWERTGRESDGVSSTASYEVQVRAVVSLYVLIIGRAAVAHAGVARPSTSCPSTTGRQAVSTCHAVVDWSPPQLVRPRPLAVGLLWRVGRVPAPTCVPAWLETSSKIHFDTGSSAKTRFMTNSNRAEPLFPASRHGNPVIYLGRRSLLCLTRRAIFIHGVPPLVLALRADLVRSGSGSCTVRAIVVPSGRCNRGSPSSALARAVWPPVTRSVFCGCSPGRGG